MDLKLTNRNVLVVGGASGIGLETAKAFVAEGAHVAIWDRDENVAKIGEKVADGTSSKTFGIRVDITDADAVNAALSLTVERHGGLEHLVLAAAVGSGKFGFPFTNLQPDDWRQVLETNVIGMANVAHAVTPWMVERKSGTMVFVASVAGQMGSQTDPPYSASKAANINFSQCMAKDLAPNGIRVNTVCPGMVITPLAKSVWKAWHDQSEPNSRLSFDDWASSKIQSLVPLGRWQPASSIAEMIVFLSSERAEHVTGQTINVDGGMVMHS